MSVPAIVQAQALAQDQTSPVVLLDYGVICDVEKLGTREAPLTESGTMNLINQGLEIDVTTTLIPAELGISFGIRSTLSEDMPLGEVRVVVTHPPMGAAGVTVESWTTSLSAGAPSLNLFSFDKDYERVLGRWSWQLISEGRILLSQEFEVLPEGSVPAVQQACFAAQAIS